MHYMKNFYKLLRNTYIGGGNINRVRGEKVISEMTVENTKLVMSEGTSPPMTDTSPNIDFFTIGIYRYTGKKKNG